MKLQPITFLGRIEYWTQTEVQEVLRIQPSFLSLAPRTLTYRKARIWCGKKGIAPVSPPSHRGSSSIVKDNEEMSFAVLTNIIFIFKKTQLKVYKNANKVKPSRNPFPRFFKSSSEIKNCKPAHHNVLTLQYKTVLQAQHFWLVYKNSQQSEVL